MTYPNVKVANCDKDGRLSITADAFNEMAAVQLMEISRMPEGFQKACMYFNFAKSCADMARDDDASYYYGLVLRQCMADGRVKEGYEQLAEEAYQGLASLTYSDDERAWERSSAILEEYRSLFETD